jgi:hypothetical protein
MIKTDRRKDASTAVVVLRVAGASAFHRFLPTVRMTATKMPPIIQSMIGFVMWIVMSDTSCQRSSLKRESRNAVSLVRKALSDEIGPDRYNVDL